MGIMGLLRKAQQQGLEAARRGTESLEDAEHRIRRSMRLQPRQQSAPIISLHGRDVDAEEIERAEDKRRIA